jgi:hypothetical protein
LMALRTPYWQRFRPAGANSVSYRWVNFRAALRTAPALHRVAQICVGSSGPAALIAMFLRLLKRTHSDRVYQRYMGTPP